MLFKVLNNSKKDYFYVYYHMYSAFLYVYTYSNYISPFYFNILRVKHSNFIVKYFFLNI